MSIWAKNIMAATQDQHTSMQTHKNLQTHIKTISLAKSSLNFYNIRILIYYIEQMLQFF